MNREIKFRVWNPRSKKFLPSYKGKGLTFNNCPSEDMEKFGCYDLEQCIDLGYIAQQFTGIINTYGREIYEGDILNGIVNRYVVIYDSNKAQFIAKGLFYEKGEYNLYEVRDSFLIGNILKNPEYLNE